MKNFSCQIQYSFYDEQSHGVGPDQNMKVQANGDMKYPISSSSENLSHNIIRNVFRMQD